MKTLKQIYIEASKEAGFTESDLPDFWYIVIQRWLKQKRQQYATDEGCNYVKRILLTDLIKELEE